MSICSNNDYQNHYAYNPCYRLPVLTEEMVDMIIPPGNNSNQETYNLSKVLPPVINGQNGSLGNLNIPLPQVQSQQPTYNYNIPLPNVSTQCQQNTYNYSIPLPQVSNQCKPSYNFNVYPPQFNCQNNDPLYDLSYIKYYMPNACQNNNNNMSGLFDSFNALDDVLCSQNSDPLDEIYALGHIGIEALNAYLNNTCTKVTNYVVNTCGAIAIAIG